MVRQWPRHVYTRHLRNFHKFFLLVTHYCLLSKSPSVPFLWCGLVLSMILLVLMLKVSGTLALWTWVSFLALYLVCLPSGLCVALLLCTCSYLLCLPLGPYVPLLICLSSGSLARLLLVGLL